MSELKNYPMFVRIICGILSVIMGCVLLIKIFYLKDYSLIFGLFSSVFGCLFLGFIAVKGVDSVMYLQRLSNKKITLNEDVLG